MSKVMIKYKHCFEFCASWVPFATLLDSNLDGVKDLYIKTITDRLQSAHDSNIASRVPDTSNAGAVVFIEEIEEIEELVGGDGIDSDVSSGSDDDSGSDNEEDAPVGVGHRVGTEGAIEDSDEEFMPSRHHCLGFPAASQRRTRQRR
jgi:hypothetical protein